MQEAYRPPCREYSFCCPNRVLPPRPDLARGGIPYLGTPPAGYPLGRVPPQAGYPPGRVPPQQGTPQQGTPQLDLAGYPPVCPMAFWEMLQSIMGYGYPPRCGLTNKVKLLPSRHTMYVGGNYSGKFSAPSNRPCIRVEHKRSLV